MSDPKIDPLPPEIAALLDREKNAYRDDPSLRANVFARVEMAVMLGGPGPGGDGPGGGHGEGGGETGSPTGGGHAPGGAAAGAAKGALATKAAIALAVGSFVAGGAVGGAVDHTLVAHEPAPIVVAARSSSPVASVVPTEATPPAEPSTSTALPAPTQSASTAAPASGRESEPRGDLTRERELLDAARAALARGNPNDAIAAAQRHAQKWPHGQLVEEREVLWIQALAAAGRVDEARARAAQFRRTFPRSVLLPAVDAAVRAPTENGSTP